MLANVNFQGSDVHDVAAEIRIGYSLKTGQDLCFTPTVECLTYLSMIDLCGHTLKFQNNLKIDLMVQLGRLSQVYQSILMTSRFGSPRICLLLHYNAGLLMSGTLSDQKRSIVCNCY
jgi:hypothetical protein